MVAVDTNVLVRLLTGDDHKQAGAARSLFEAGPVWIAKTVLLETNRVLRSLYGFEESAIREAFEKLSGLNSVHVEDKAAVACALALTVHGVGLRTRSTYVADPPARHLSPSTHLSSGVLRGPG